jgi:ribose transport system ATP-binding protein
MAAALHISGITKRFSGVTALDNVSFDIEKGAVHALLGENGAGKSTLINIISGRFSADSGTVTLFDIPAQFSTPAEARKAGISVVHQEIFLVGTLTVAENIFLGRPYMKGRMVDWKTMRVEARKLLEGIGISIDVDRLASSLSISEQQIVEICKALTLNAKVIIMDEPSATLTEKEIRILFSIIYSLKAQGITIVYISHRLDEVFKIANRLTVLRDGKHITTRDMAGTDKTMLVSLMVGRSLGEEFPKVQREIGATILEVQGLSSEKLSDVSFHLRKGEILGIAGLVGAGRTELMRAILGIDQFHTGRILLNGIAVSFKNFRQAIQRGFAFVTEDRKRQGLVHSMSVKHNITLCAIDQIVSCGFLNSGKERELAVHYSNRLRISVSALDAQVMNLSGGNQQKVCIAKWLPLDSTIFIIDEPTRGIDIGAKIEIYKILNSLVSEGKSVIMVSSEMPELLGMCDRIYVMHEGKIAGELEWSEATQEKIMNLCV